MKMHSVLCVVLSLGLSTAAAFGRGGMGSSHMSVTGGALGTSAATPGTNGALVIRHRQAHERTTAWHQPAIDREEAKVDKMIGSISRGC